MLHVDNVRIVYECVRSYVADLIMREQSRMERYCYKILLYVCVLTGRLSLERIVGMYYPEWISCCI